MKTIFTTLIIAPTLAVATPAFSNDASRNAGLWLAISKACGIETSDIVLAYQQDAAAEGESQDRIHLIARTEAAKIMSFVKRRGKQVEFCTNGQKDAALLRTDEGVDTCPNPDLLRCPLTPELLETFWRVTAEN
ncbi:hypothetical protein GOB08_19065 [Sinorhizobium meliloti]|nr:hypothetical protein [Sinorhizobium meliloti]